MQEFEQESMEPRIIKTQDEEGKVHNFELIDIIYVEEQAYGLLIYLDEHAEHPAATEDDEEEEEVFIMRLSKQDDAYTLETIEDEDEFNKVVSILEEEGQLELDEDEE